MPFPFCTWSRKEMPLTTIRRANPLIASETSTKERMVPYVTVVVPAKNESQRLPQTIGKLRAALDTQRLEYEIIVVDDGSDDNTAFVAEKLDTIVIRHKECQGIAASIRSGSMAASGRYVMACPADVPNFDFLANAIYASKKFDIVSISKRHPLSVVVGYGPWRWMLSNSYQMLVTSLFGIPKNLTDTHYIKFYKSDLLMKVIAESSINGPVGETELIINMLRNGASWIEVPARIEHDHNQSKTSITLVAKAAYEIAILYFRQLRKGRIKDQ
jgi:glycosyltransferase involved in cell wall biosynthesis